MLFWVVSQKHRSAGTGTDPCEAPAKPEPAKGKKKIEIPLKSILRGNDWSWEWERTEQSYFWIFFVYLSVSHRFWSSERTSLFTPNCQIWVKIWVYAPKKFPNQFFKWFLVFIILAINFWGIYGQNMTRIFLSISGHFRPKQNTSFLHHKILENYRNSWIKSSNFVIFCFYPQILHNSNTWWLNTCPQKNFIILDFFRPWTHG